MKRILSHAEVGLVKRIFKSSINCSSVHIYNKKWTIFQAGDRAMTPRGEIYAPDEIYSEDYGSFGSRPDDKHLFIHEMVHVWQWQQRILDPIRSAINLSANGKFSYNYKLDGRKDLLDYNMEQQADIIADYFLNSLFGYKNVDSSASGTVSQYVGVLNNFLKNPNYAKNYQYSR